MQFKHQAKLLKAIRKSLGLSQVQLAKALGVHPQFVSNMERGVAGIPVKLAKRIIKKFDWQLADFYFAAKDDFEVNWKKEWI